MLLSENEKGVSCFPCWFLVVLVVCRWRVFYSPFLLGPDEMVTWPSNCELLSGKLGWKREFLAEAHLAPRRLSHLSVLSAHLFRHFLARPLPFSPGGQEECLLRFIS